MIADLLAISEDAPSQWPILGPRSDRLELPIQLAFRKLMRVVGPTVKIVAIPNAGKRGFKAQRQVKLEGLTTGFVDLMTLWASGSDVSNAVPSIAFLEFKKGAATPLSVSISQREQLDWLAARNFPCGVFRNEITAVEWLKSLGAPIALASNKG